LSDQIEQGSRTAPRIFFAGPLLDGATPVWPAMSIMVDTPDRARHAVEFLASQNVSLSRSTTGYRKHRCRSSGHRAQHGLRVTGHVPRTITMTRAIQLGWTPGTYSYHGPRAAVVGRSGPLDRLPVARRETLLWERFELESEPMQRLVRLIADSRVFFDPRCWWTRH